MRPNRFLAVPALALALSALLAACGGKDRPADGTAAGADPQSLPAPAGAGAAGVTGMPSAPGPGQVGAPVEGSTAGPLFDENGDPIPGSDAGTPAAGIDGTLPPPESGTETGTPPLAAEPTPEDAVAVVRDYYAAINGGNFARAHALWSDGGNASGQNAQQFANGFAETTGVSVEVLAPGRVDAGAGQRYVEVPVAITATQLDGSQRKYVGAYTLRRSVVDGASDEQRAWRIGSADIREVRQ
ncbi:hypothetical protein [Lysobacter sp. ESA13C]|uniref:hypothetical protein n=1 Tax=Lysobacter sp. ESA13C TaxID=2862676 RepID=UPI001CBC8D84|nr:hypothetical protein [Lysobacter sp. ESA13C]